MFFEFFGQRRGGEHKACAAVIEDVRELFAFQKDVEWDGYRADRGNGEIGGNKFGESWKRQGRPCSHIVRLGVADRRRRFLLRV